jgi:alginate O-acetyltransferase complex protein AlgI
MAFLYRSDPNSLPIVLAMSVITYGAGHVIHKGKRPGLYHLLGLILLVAALTMFKYMGFLSGIVSRIMDLFSHPGRFKIDNLIMPLGISYIVFKHISYLTDIKWKLVSPGRFMDFLLYSSLFTIFVAGPIERFERFKPQVEVSRIPFFWSDIDTGFSRIVFGLFKKLVIADWLGYFIAPVWASPWQYGKWTGLLALLGYSLQIYFDFSGYSDIAIGSSRLFGIRIMENFKNPYFAPNISTFWRRWHISLSDWIRDYIFFPLSRFSKNKVWAIFFVPVIAMGLCGLWHGAAWHFVFWGLWHGVGLFIFQIWSNYKRKYRSRGNFNPGRWIISFAICANFTFVSVGWNLFR